MPYSTFFNAWVQLHPVHLFNREIVMRSLVTGLVGFVVVVAYANVLIGSTVIVDCNGGGDYLTIQEGIDAAVDGDTVLVMTCTYYEHDIDFLGKAITVMSTNPEDSAVVKSTIVDADSSGMVFYFHLGEDTTSVLAGFTITGGSSGGIICEASSPIIANNVITGNLADFGAGIECNNSHVQIRNCKIIANGAWGGYGGGIECGGCDSTMTITDCTIKGNWAAHYGGGLRLMQSSPRITNCTIDSNSVFGGTGGGILMNGSSPEIRNCKITRNWNEFQDGGGIVIEGPSSTLITNCTFEENWANRYGGGVYCLSVSPTITNCTFKANSAEERGGGIFFHGPSDPPPAITNCTFTENSANFGGGISCLSSEPNITNCTLTKNSANYGGGISSQHQSSPIIVNTILWGDSASTGPEIWIGTIDYPSTLMISYSDVEGGQDSVFVDEGCTLNWGAGMIDADPLFADSLYHLQLISPCIDAGDPSILDACRPPGLGDERSDMGAYGGEGNCGWSTELIDLLLLPDEPQPVVIQKGDYLDFLVYIQNNLDNTVSGDLWFSALLPNMLEVMIPGGLLHLENPLSGQIFPFNSIELSNALFVHTRADTGSYSLIGRVGRYPDNIIDEESFGFRVVE
jgi:predicted outer membrane repeat protein